MTIMLPSGNVVRLDNFNSFVFEPLAVEDAPLPQGYLNFNDGTHLALSPADAWALQECLKSTSHLLEISGKDKEREAKIEARQKREEDERKKREEVSDGKKKEVKDKV